MLYLIPVILFGALGVWMLTRHRRHQRLAALLATPLSPAQRAHLAEVVPLTRKLPSDLRPGLEGRINRFLDQVKFIGAGGLEVTDDMRLSIAAQACLLIVNSDSWYDRLTTVLIYPGAFKSLRAERQGYVVRERETVRIGESWNLGPVILSWAHTEEGAANPEDGHNVVFHEFAHQLDDLSGRTDGIPVLARDHDGDAWEAAFVDGLARLIDAQERGQPTEIDPYGTHGYEEYFAVTVEMFFEQPARLREVEPAVYAQLAEFFSLDPASW